MITITSSTTISSVSFLSSSSSLANPIRKYQQEGTNYFSCNQKAYCFQLFWILYILSIKYTIALTTPFSIRTTTGTIIITTTPSRRSCLGMIALGIGKTVQHTTRTILYKTGQVRQLSAASFSSLSNSLQTTTDMVVVPKDVTFQCIDGMTIAGQSWETETTTTINTNESEEERILCLHGWMDNCRSFYQLVPEIINHYDSDSTTPKKKCHVFAMDFPGHGLSSHKSIDTPPSLLAESVFYVNDIIHQLQWDSSSSTTTISNNDSTESSTKTTTTTKKIEPFTIIGHSMGTGIACLYAAAFPEHVKKLILLEGGTCL
jgi:alpha/beta hydrolase fold